MFVLETEEEHTLQLGRATNKACTIQSCFTISKLQPEDLEEGDSIVYAARYLRLGLTAYGPTGYRAAVRLGHLFAHWNHCISEKGLVQDYLEQHGIPYELV